MQYLFAIVSFLTVMISHRRLFLTVRKKHRTLRVEKTAASGLGTWAPLPRPDALRHLTVPPGYIYLTTYFHFLLFSPICIFFIFQLCVSFFLSTYLYSFFSSFFITLAFFVLFLFLSSLPVHFIFAFFLYLSLCIHITSRHGHGNLSRRQSSLSAYACLRISFFLFFVLHTLGCVLFYFCISLRV